eukprot:CAMPEP_0172401242 /NCGR_PEP_ID=MMETSP1061-20121228/49309_1 /TAXON_ID=37318 /ORGANISM="Pseudo-nitzschia pungens, Strain cf. pungens" /LENGTH=79 /DNA_ID=CAMNT_0013134819 /DNA_START=45 /DNA_END=281 /DNA_ORIENTATION=-
MPLTDGTHVAYTGLYKCKFYDYTSNETDMAISTSKNLPQEGQNQESQQEQPIHCTETRKVANGFNRDGTLHASLPLYNL